MPANTPNVFTYPREEPGTQGHFDLIEPLGAMPRDLAHLLQGISEAEATFRPAEGRWCIKELVGHLRDSAEVDHKRLYMMSTQTDPLLELYDPDAYSVEHEYMSRSIDQMMDELREWRADTVQLLTTLVNWNWARTGQHLEDGRVSIRQLVEDTIEHEADHVASVRELRIAAAGL